MIKTVGKNAANKVLTATLNVPGINAEQVRALIICIWRKCHLNHFWILFSEVNIFWISESYFLSSPNQSVLTFFIDIAQFLYCGEKVPYEAYNIRYLDISYVNISSWREINNSLWDYNIFVDIQDLCLFKLQSAVDLYVPV